MGYNTLSDQTKYSLFFKNVFMALKLEMSHWSFRPFFVKLPRTFIKGVHVSRPKRLFLTLVPIMLRLYF